MKKYILPLIFIFGFLNISFAQFDDDDDNGYRHHNRFHFKRYFEKPKIEVSYGLSNLKLDGFINKFENTSLGEIKLGYSGQWSSWYGKNVLKYNFGYVTFGTYTTDLDSRTKTVGNLKSSLWRFGIGNEDGYNIKAGSIGIIPYTSGAMVWSSLDMKQLPDSSNLTDLNRILLYNKTMRFGNVYNGGIDFQFTRMFGFNLSYERANIYQRHLFFRNFVSQLIEQAGAGMIDEFVGSILRHEPVAGAIVNFVLKNAYYFGFNQLRSKQMNWPLGGEATLNYSTFKAGLTFSF